MTNASPTCLINGSSTLNGVNVTAGSTVTISLADKSGVSLWQLSCVGTDETNTAAAINAQILASINHVTKTATFTAPAIGSALVFQSKINSGRNINNQVDPTYTTRFGAFVLGSTGGRVIAFGQKTEGDVNFGWLSDINPIIRDGVPADLTAGAGLSFSGTTLNVGQNADNSITVNANDIQLKAAYQTLLDGATSSASPLTLALRDTVGRIQLSSNGGLSHVLYGGAITADPDATFGISQETQTSDDPTADISITTQAPFASASGSNRLPGNIYFNVPVAAGALATTNSGSINFTWQGNNLIQLYEDTSDNTAVINFVNFGRIDECSSVNSSAALTLNATTALSLNGAPIALLSAGDITIDTDSDVYITATSAINLNGSLGTIVRKDNIGIDEAQSQFIVKNLQPAVVGGQQASFVKLVGQGWKTTATAASQEVAYYIENLPVQGSSNPGSQLRFLYQINGGSVNTGFYHDSVDSNFGNSLHCSTMVSSSGGHRFDGSTNNGGLDLNGSSELRLKSYNTKAFVVETGADSGGTGGVERLRIEGAGTISLSTSSTVTFSKNGTSAKVDTFDPVGASTQVWAAGVTSVSQSWTQRASGAGGPWTIAGQQGFAGSIGGKLILQSGYGGTLGTNLAGGIDLDLGQTASGASSVLTLKAGASGTIGTQQVTGAGNYYIASGAVASGMYLDTGNMYLHGSLSFAVDSNTGLITFYKAASSALSLTVSNNGATTFAPVAGSTSMTFKQATAAGSGVASSASTTLSAQDAKAVASGTNNTGGNLILSSGAVGTGGSGGTAGTVSIKAGAVEAIAIGGSGELGFYSGSTPVAKQTISGSRGGNAALADLLTKLASLGLIIDGTTA